MATPQRLQEFLRNYLAALQFLTRIPVRAAAGTWADFSEQRLRAGAAHFPGVGLLVGAGAAVVFALLSIALPPTPATPFVAAAGSTIATLLLTGAFHEDGLADLADGLGGSSERQRALEIMKDSRVGSFGALALVAVFVAKAALLACLAFLSPALVLLALLAAHATSRFWPLLLIHSLPHVGDAAGSKSKPLADSITRAGLCVAAAWCSAPLLALAWAQGPVLALCASAFAAATLVWMRRLLVRRLQGYTGDGLGAAQQLTEIAFYLGAAVAWRA